MFLVVAALEEELDAGMALCQNRKRVHDRSPSLWQAEREGKKVCFLKAGFGPKRSAASLERALNLIRPDRILVIGYAGGLEANLKLGDLVAVRKALGVSLEKGPSGWDDARIDYSFELLEWESLVHLARSAGLTAYVGDAITSAYVLGEPAHKATLNEKFHASIVDMETAALAHVAFNRSIPISCIRAISDELHDTFLAPFSHNPLGKISERARKLLSTGMVQAFRDWRVHAAVAKKSLSRFLSYYL